MIIEQYDKNSGAILFKKDADSKRKDQEYQELLEYTKKLESRIKALEKKQSNK